MSVLDQLGLPMPDQPNPYLAQMARFSNGELHEARRAAVLAALPSVDGLEERALALAEARAGERVDVVPIAQTVPVVALGEALGVGDLSLDIGALCETGAAAPSLPPVPVTSILFQCRDATAALIVNALAGGIDVEQAPAVVGTRRAGDVWVELDQVPFGAGAHACPGREHAFALARGVVHAFADHRVVEVGADDPRPNLRMPVRLVLEPRGRRLCEV